MLFVLLLLKPQNRFINRTKIMIQTVFCKAPVIGKRAATTLPNVKITIHTLS